MRIPVRERIRAPAILLKKNSTFVKLETLVFGCTLRLSIKAPAFAKVVPAIAAIKIPADKIFLKFFIFCFSWVF